MVDLKQILTIIRIPAVILVCLTSIGILIDFLDNYLIIVGWWIFVLILCTLLSAWSGFDAAKKKLSINESGIAGAITWFIPGTVGLVIVGITQYINALLWGSVEGYEVIAFIVGFVIILFLLALGSGINYIAGAIGGFIAKVIK